MSAGKNERVKRAQQSDQEREVVRSNFVSCRNVGNFFLLLATENPFRLCRSQPKNHHFMGKKHFFPTSYFSLQYFPPQMLSSRVSVYFRHVKFSTWNEWQSTPGSRSYSDHADTQAARFASSCTPPISTGVLFLFLKGLHLDSKEVLKWTIVLFCPGSPSCFTVIGKHEEG